MGPIYGLQQSAASAPPLTATEPATPDVNLELVQLASRIAAHLHGHPKDEQARSDLLHVVQRMAGPQGTAAQANAQDAATARAGANLGPAATAVQRGANAMSFGLGDVVGRAVEGPQYQSTVDESVARNPGSALVGTIAGGAVPFMLTGAGGLLPRTLIGAAEGFGIGDGNVGQRSSRAVLGAAGAAVAPAVARGVGSVARGTVGRVLGRFFPATEGAASAGATSAAEAAASNVAEGPTPMEVRAAMKQMGVNEATARDLIVRAKQGIVGRSGGLLSPGQSVPAAPPPVSRGLLTPVGEAQMPGVALHGPDGSPLLETRIPGPALPPQGLLAGPPMGVATPAEGMGAPYTQAVQAARRSAGPLHGLSPAEARNAARISYHLRTAFEDLPVGNALSPAELEIVTRRLLGAGWKAPKR